MTTMIKNLSGFCVSIIGDPLGGGNSSKTKPYGDLWRDLNILPLRWVNYEMRELFFPNASQPGNIRVLREEKLKVA